jgi:Fe-S-cluster containining protein
MIQRNYLIQKPAGTCQRCATCCRKGGPALHLEDQPLIQSGQIPAANLYTLRKGEWVRDNVRGNLCQLATELIKIKGQGNRWTCTFLDIDQSRCTIYDRRPIECRRLQCWNPEPLQKIYAHNRLTRRDLFYSAKGLWDLIATHEQECNYADIQQLADRVRDHQSTADLERLDYILRYDANMRCLASEKAKVNPDLCDLLFGRPISATLKMFGLKVENAQGIFRISATTKPVD